MRSCRRVARGSAAAADRSSREVVPMDRDHPPGAAGRHQLPPILRHVGQGLLAKLADAEKHDISAPSGKGARNRSGAGVDQQTPAIMFDLDGEAGALKIGVGAHRRTSGAVISPPVKGDGTCRLCNSVTR